MSGNWPHPSLSDPPNDTQLFNCIAEWIPDTTLRQRIFVENPARLYGFWRACYPTAHWINHDS